jgi:hypothetical protein
MSVLMLGLISPSIILIAFFLKKVDVALAFFKMEITISPCGK